MKERNVRNYCCLFKEGRTNVDDKEQSGRPSLVTDDLKKLNSKIWENREFISSELQKHFLVGQKVRSDQRQKTCRTGCKGWRQPFPTKAYKNWSHEMTSAFIYLASI